MAKHFIYLLLAVAFNKIQEAPGYNVSVVEYRYQYLDGISPESNLGRNVAAHANIIRYLKGKSDLVVFPENSLSPSDGPHAVYVSVPSPSFSYQNITHKGLQRIVDAAKSSNIYVVISVPERAGKYRYSTSLVLRKNGTVAARYRKYHVTNKDVDRPDQPESVYFQTDMGDAFGLFSSEDILFQNPASDLIKKGIRHFVYPTCLSSRLPFLTGNQMQQSWSWSEDVTLLAAGLNNVATGRTGSGIFTGRKGHLTRQPVRYYMANSPTTLIITGSLQPIYSVSTRENYDRHFNFRSYAALSKNVAKTYDHTIPQDVQLFQTDSSQLKLTGTSLKHFKSELVTPEGHCSQRFDSIGGEIYRCRQRKRLCHNDLCCQFDITVDYLVCPSPCKVETYVRMAAPVDGFFLFRYRMAAFDGIDNPWSDGETFGLQICSVVPCLDHTVESCGKAPQSVNYKANVFTIQGVTKKIWAQSISIVDITGNFTSNSSTAMMPNLLMGGSELHEVARFGSVSNNFVMDKRSGQFSLPEQIRNLGTAGVLNRVFSRDGFASEAPRINGSSIISVILTALFYIFYRY